METKQVSKLQKGDLVSLGSSGTGTVTSVLRNYIIERAGGGTLYDVVWKHEDPSRSGWVTLNGEDVVELAVS